MEEGQGNHIGGGGEYHFFFKSRKGKYSDRLKLAGLITHISET